MDGTGPTPPTSMTWKEFERRARDAAAWARTYREGLRDRPVRAQTAPGALLSALPEAAPEQGEDLDAVLADLDALVTPGITHWQHPRFFAYFPANAHPASVLAEHYTAAIAAQCMLWQTSPAATELETRMVGWMRDALGLPAGWTGAIADSASSATLSALLTMRERALAGAGNREGLSGHAPVRVYATAENHSSVERAAWVTGIGSANLVTIPATGPRRGMDPAALRAAIRADRAAGMIPAGVVACVGGTSVGGTDPLAEVCAVAREEGLYTHVDAAWAGSAMICPEFRALWAGVEGADSLVFNPHKWLGAQFDCSIHFVADPAPLLNALSISPTYLETWGADGVVNYSEWTVPLGRRFRALKLWFLLRAEGLSGLRAMIRNHVRWTAALCERLRAAGFEIVTEPMLALFAFRPAGADDAAVRALVQRINDDGRIYLTQTMVDGRLAIRFQAGTVDCTQADVAAAFDVITELA